MSAANDVLITGAEVRRQLGGISRSTLHKRVTRGDFPPPAEGGAWQQSSPNLWWQSDVDKHHARLRAQREQKLAAHAALKEVAS